MERAPTTAVNGFIGHSPIHNLTTHPKEFDYSVLGADQGVGA